MYFSKEFNDRGKFSLYKLFHMFTIIGHIWRIRFRHRVKTMYYPISSAPPIALLRDTVILMCTRFLFKEIIYHFHAAGISEELPKYPWIIKTLIFTVLKHPELAITSSEYNPKDAEYLQAKQIEIVPLGIPDDNSNELRKTYGKKKYLTVMFMGLLNGTKGEGYILESIYLLNKSGRDVRMVFAGKFENEEYRNKFFNKVKEYKLTHKVEYKGIVTGTEKRQMFLNADVFCFPSFFNSESFGIVLLEAMMYQMPLIASRWRGIQSIIEEGKNGFLVDIKNATQITEKLKLFYDDPTILERMSQESRKLYMEKYELSKYTNKLEEILSKN